MLQHNLDELLASGERFLLLQGPIGHFFRELAQWLEAQGKQCTKINFNFGDEHFYPEGSSHNVIAYTSTLDAFEHDLTDLVQREQIQAIICFGDNRYYHTIAKHVAEKFHLTFWAFEEGYFRPHFITLEKDGVNDFSTIPRSADFYLEHGQHLTLPSEPIPVASGFMPVARLAIRYYTKAYWNRTKYPHYKHHRLLNINYYIRLWVISGLKRLCYALEDANFAKRVARGEFGDFYIVPLQVYDDSQVRVHSDFATVRDFLEHVLTSFAQHAPEHVSLIVKHHPMDRGFIDYSDVIKKFKHRDPKLKHRIFYIHDVAMPIFLQYGKGMVTLNSTSGISALIHNMPILTLGRANYNMSGLTYQGSLDEFWHNPIAPDKNVFTAFRHYHMNKTQLNGNFYTHTILRTPYNQNAESESS
ncbi:capsule biosynthesis protein [Spirabiliibacterium falconis]|uniref:capsule biosynthesis protein n=1 Tax=Spirabiliibacterium falconis TaxID=572023 RepID=UPI001AAD57A6|nr:capsule biosynthesis protein [Spirabiliibacterium falconis]MBE2893679.1 capsule biosynthesis protein [Spirabiliibacterium falconis]